MKRFQWNLAAIFDMRAGIARTVFSVRSQRSRSKVKVTARPTVAEAYISTAWRRVHLLQPLVILVVCLILIFKKYVFMTSCAR